MSLIQAQKDTTESFDTSIVVLTWAGLVATGDVGSAESYANYGDKTFVASGNFGAGVNITIEGSNDGTNWVTLSNRQGTAMTFAGLGMNTSQDKPVWVRPRVTAGTGGNVTVSVCCHHSDIPIRG